MPAFTTNSPPLDDPVGEMIADAGYGSRAAEAFAEFDAAYFQHVRMVLRGEMPRQLLAELGLELDLTQFHALTAIRRIGAGIGRDRPQAPTVGLLAEELALDPSRASRLASELIAKGYLRRAADQEDGRKSILEPTAKAEDAFAAFRVARWRRMLGAFEGWSEDEVETFATLFSRFVGGHAARYATPRET